MKNRHAALLPSSKAVQMPDSRTTARLERRDSKFSPCSSSRIASRWRPRAVSGGVRPRALFRSHRLHGRAKADPGSVAPECGRPRGGRPVRKTSTCCSPSDSARVGSSLSFLQPCAVRRPWSFHTWPCLALSTCTNSIVIRLLGRKNSLIGEKIRLILH
jgi:hypothetical protein